VSDAELPPTASGSLTAQQLPDAAPKAGPRYPRAGYDGPNKPFQTESKTFTSEQRTPPVIVDSSLSTPDLLAAAGAAANSPIPSSAQPKVFPGNSTSRIQAGPATGGQARPTVPSGEFDNAAKTVPDNTPPVIASGATRNDEPTKVPTGEFDSGAGTLDQLTMKREASPGAAARAAIARSGGGAGKAGSAVRVPRRAATPDKFTDVDELLDDDDVEHVDDDQSDGDGDGDGGGRGAGDARIGDEQAGGGRGIGIGVDPYLQARGDATAIDPQTNKFERGDPTQDKPPDATEIQAPTGGRRHHATGGTLRPSAALRRKRGLLGDVRYVFTAVFGVRQSRRELAELEHRQELRQTSRKRHLVTLGRTAVVTDAFDHPALGKARDQLQRIEEERGRHAGAVAASDAELERVRRDRETKAKEYVETTMKTDAELAELAKKLEPLEKEAAGVKRRAQELRETVQRVDKKIADTEALMVSVKGEKMDKAAIQADIVTFRADKEAVLRDEPVIAAQLDGLNPRIAAIEASRAELQKKKVELQRAEDEDQRRTSELLAAIGAKRKVVERAAAEAEQARDTALLELGDRLYVDRPKSLSNLLSPVDQIDLELGESDRRIMELREILSNIDRWKFSRGLAMIIVTLAIAGCFVWWLVAMLS
jgi:prefoldin subunit 5